MSMISDPELQAAPRRASYAFDAGNRTPLVRADSPAALRAKRSGVRSVLYGVLAGVTAFTGLQFVASAFADPLVLPTSAAAPAWQVEITTTSSSSGLALAYGREVGVQFLRIPPRGAKGDDARVIPARLARGELHIVTLRPSFIHVEAPGAPGSGVVRMSANGAVVTLFQSPKLTGIRSGF